MPAVGSSWGRYPTAHQNVVRLRWRNQSIPSGEDKLLPYGNGRSYGDSCLNDGGTLLHARGLNRFIAFDRQAGIMRCEAGVLFADILEIIVPHGWFLPVTPGTRFVTVGGAVANDVHGKNHHRAGTFGEHVRCFELLRSDGSRQVCSPNQNHELFQATIGGLGLTGVITWVEFSLMRIPGRWVQTETFRFHGLADFFDLTAQSENDFAYTVAWIDCTGTGKRFGRGLFFRANHTAAIQTPSAGRRWSVPFIPPVSLVNRWSLRMFNAAYFHGTRSGQRLTCYEPYFYPLDKIENWNRIYGPRGFLQYQCVVPKAHSPAVIDELLRRIVASGTGSFLAVLKVFSDRPPAGILSFPRAGTTLALDFPNRGPKTFALLDQLDDVVASVDGAVYPAKDARMSGAHFRQFFPRWDEMLKYIDPRFSSSFWRRVSE